MLRYIQDLQYTQHSIERKVQIVIKYLTFSVRKHNHRPSFISDIFKHKIDETVNEDGLQSISRIRGTLFDEFPYSLSTYYRMVHLMDYT